MWQSDNDDDGNAWTRFNYVLPFGNFGYWGPGGKGWREDRGAHFHQENPGVVPNVARLGAGSPTGLFIYEGNLLPPQYRGQPIHTEAGKRVVNSYTIESAGAKYVFCGKIPQLAGPWEDLTVKFVFRGYGAVELQAPDRRKMEAIKRIAGKIKPCRGHAGSISSSRLLVFFPVNVPTNRSINNTV